LGGKKIPLKATYGPEGVGVKEKGGKENHMRKKGKKKDILSRKNRTSIVKRGEKAGKGEGFEKRLRKESFLRFPL